MRCRALVDLLDRPEDDPEVVTARQELLADECIRGLVIALRDEKPAYGKEMIRAD